MAAHVPDRPSPMEQLVADRLREAASDRVASLTVRRLTRVAVHAIENALIEQAMTAPPEDVPGLANVIGQLNGSHRDEAIEILNEMREGRS